MTEKVYRFEKYKRADKKRRAEDEKAKRIKELYNKAILELADMIDQGISIENRHVEVIRSRNSLEYEPSTNAGYIIDAYSESTRRELDRISKERGSLRICHID